MGERGIWVSWSGGGEKLGGVIVELEKMFSQLMSRDAQLGWQIRIASASR